jgi:hypothetical protein
MTMRSPARELAAIALVGAVLLGAQAVIHVLFPPDDAPDVWLGGILKPGMSEASARAVLNKRYDLLKSAGEKYYLRTKDGLSPWMKRAVPSERIEGAVWFHQGKLTRLSRDWYRGDTGGTDATALANAVQDAVMVATHLNKEGRCEVSTETRKSSSAEVKETDVSCGRRMVRIVMSRASGAPTAQFQVSEEIK